MQKSKTTQYLWPTYVITLFLSSLLISWHTLATVDFGYSSAYKLLSIPEHIQQFAPINRNKKHFETTNKEEHHRLFSEIVVSIQDGGKGLADISYYYQSQPIPYQPQPIPLLIQAEVLHLQDVANLIDTLYPVGIGMILISLLLIALIRHFKLPAPSLFQATASIRILLLALAATLIIFGPEEVFNWFHIQVFPEGHQWFFYFQESLMATLMKPPDLFAFMGAVVGVFALIIFTILLGGSLVWQKRQ